MPPASRPGALLLQGLFGAGDDVVLSLAGQHVKEGAVARHPDNQVPVVLRVDLGVQKGLPGDLVFSICYPL